jgi:hypothetical protein
VSAEAGCVTRDKNRNGVSLPGTHKVQN